MKDNITLTLCMAISPSLRWFAGISVYEAVPHSISCLADRIFGTGVLRMVIRRLSVVWKLAVHRQTSSQYWSRLSLDE